MPVTSGVSQGSDLGPILFIIYINDNDLALNNFTNIFVTDTTIGSVVLSEGDRWSQQEDLRRISDWSVKWKMPFNIYKWQILQSGSRNIKNDLSVYRFSVMVNV